ncbi:DNA-invertase hin [compost metagenome]
MTRAIAYLRVSTQEQASSGISLAAQEAKVRAFADLYDLELVEVVVDGGVSAKSLNRPGLSRALEALEDARAEALVIAKLDRLTRSVADWGTLIDRYFSRQFALLSVADQIDTRTAAGRLVLNVLVSVAQWEREAIGERTAAALEHKKNIGEHVGRPPFGYRISEKRLALVSEEAKVITLVLSLRAEGWTLQRIADELTARGIATKRGGKWYPTQIKSILSRAANRATA